MTHFTNKTVAVFLLTFLFSFSKSQSISSERISFNTIQSPKINVDEANRTFSVKVSSPYSLSADDVIAKSKEDFKKEESNFPNVILESKKKYQEDLKNYELDVKKAKEQYEVENAAYKNLTLIERLALMDKGQTPKLRVPTKPVYMEPSKPKYHEPNLNEYFIVDNNVIASQINIEGFTKGNPYVDVDVFMSKVGFQDNASQTYANQPTKIIVKVNGIEKINETLSSDYEFVSSSSSDNINRINEEKIYLQKTIKNINKFLTQNLGFQKLNKEVVIESVKNKGAYDDLEKANIYVTTNFKKMQGSDAREVALNNMQKGIDIWNESLKRINYKDPKAEYNSKIARMIYFNLIRTNLALSKKEEAEKYLNQLQDNLVYIKLDYSEKIELDRLEKEIYKTK